MNIQIKPLTNTSIVEIKNTFNEAFNDYFIKLQLTDETLAAKIKSENILLPYSVGAFDDDRLVGFILHGYDVIEGTKTVYNAGTGVTPAYRGKGITGSMYQYIIPVLQKENIHTHMLEVIDNNLRAIKIYEQAGFKKTRTLSAFKTTKPIAGKEDIAVKEIDRIDPCINKFISMQPAWQNSLQSVERDKEGHTLLGVFEQDELIAFAAFVPETGRVKQCAVHPDHRRKGIGTSLFSRMHKKSKTGELVVTNIDVTYQAGIFFLEALGFKKLLGLIEMKLVLQ